MKKIEILIICLFCFCSTACSNTSSSQEASSDKTRIVQDMSGELIEVPEKIGNIAITWTGLTDIVLMLDGADHIKAYPEKSNSFKLLLNKYPLLNKAMYLPEDGISAEALVQEDINIVFAKCSNDETLVKNLRESGITVIDCEFKTYEELQQVITLISDVLGTSQAIEKADKYNTYINDKVSNIKTQVSKISKNDRPKVLVLKDVNNYSAYGSSRYTGKWTELSGGNYVMVNQDTYANVNLTQEQLLEYDPEIIFFTMPLQAKKFSNLNEWSGLKCVKNEKVYNVPSVFNTWSNSGAESALIFEWAFSKMYPEKTKYDEEKAIRNFYQTFYDCKFTEQEISIIVEESN